MPSSSRSAGPITTGNRIARSAAASRFTRSRPVSCGNAAACRYQFSVTARTIFADRKRPIRDYLLAIAIFVNGAKGHSALQLSRDLDCQYKTAFVLAHKLREAMGSEVHNPDQPELSGTVEIDGAYFGGNVKPANRKASASTAASPRNRPASARS